MRTLDDWVYCVKVLSVSSRDEWDLMSSSEDGTVKVWKLDTGVCLETFNVVLDKRFELYLEE